MIFANPILRSQNKVLTSENETLKKTNDELRCKIAQLESQLAEQIKINEDTENAIFSFDFKKMDAFSVERNFHNGRPCTIIGYLLPKEVMNKDGQVTNLDSVREWYLYCSIDQHAKLVADFEKAKKK